MKLWLVFQDVNQGYDTYDSIVVAAKSEEEARHIEPSNWATVWEWANSKDLQVKHIGTALKGTKAGVILASFNAG